MEQPYSEPRPPGPLDSPDPLKIDGLIDPDAFGERMIFDPVVPGGAVSACGKCGKSIGILDDRINVENELNELKRHIYRNPEILRDIMNRWNIVPQAPELDKEGPNP